MQVKSQLRKSIKIKRHNIKDKGLISNTIAEILFNTKQYINSKTVLCYASLDDEISTDIIINHSLDNGKQVALPYCISDNGDMEFYIINSMDDLILGHFNVREPDISKCTLLKDFNDAIIIVPALCFDKNGYRLGYGKGYYDRFLKNNTLNSVGLCYNSLIVDKIPINKYDVPVDCIITQDGIIVCNNGGKDE